VHHAEGEGNNPRIGFGEAHSFICLQHFVCGWCRSTRVNDDDCFAPLSPPCGKAAPRYTYDLLKTSHNLASSSLT
jgi:hypothetical protein